VSFRFLNVLVKPDPTLISAATSAATENIRFEVVSITSSIQTRFGFWLFGALKKRFKGNHFTCDEVQAAMAQWFQEQPEDFYSNMFTTLFCTGTVVLNKKQATWRNEVQKRSTYSELHFVVCFILISCLGVKRQTWKRYLLNTLCRVQELTFSALLSSFICKATISINPRIQLNMI
jgi:hypothetical protein